MRDEAAAEHAELRRMLLNHITTTTPGELAGKQGWTVPTSIGFCSGYVHRCYLEEAAPAHI